MNLLAVHETTVQSLSQEDPLQKGMATHSSFLAWRVPWTEELGRLQFMGLQRVGLNWATHTQWVEKMWLQRAGHNWATHTHECSPEQTPSALVGCKMLDTCTKWKHVVAKSWTWLSNTHTHTCSPVRWTLSDTHTYGPGHFQTHTHVPLWGGHLQTDRQKHACARIWTTDFVSPDEVHRCSVRRWCDWPPSSGLLSSLCMQVGLPLRKRADRILHTNWEFQLPCLINSLFFFNSNKRLMFQI